MIKKMPPRKTAAERQKEYRDKLKRENPEKFKKLKEQTAARALAYYRKKQRNLTEEQKKELRLQRKYQERNEKYLRSKPKDKSDIDEPKPFPQQFPNVETRRDIRNIQCKMEYKREKEFKELKHNMKSLMKEFQALQKRYTRQQKKNDELNERLNYLELQNTQGNQLQTMNFDVAIKLEPLEEDIPFSEQSQNAQLVKYEQTTDLEANPSNSASGISVKIEPVEGCDDVLMDFIKEEMDIGPTEFYRPVVSNKLEDTFDEQQQELVTKTTKPNKELQISRKAKRQRYYEESKKRSENQLLQCELCSVEFTYTANLKRHMKEYHNKNRTKSLTCKICDKQFRRLYSLLRHQKSGVRCKSENHTFKCPCGKTFRQKSNMRRHRAGYCEKSHIERGVFVCDLCGKVFPNRVRLSVHIGHHKRTKDFERINEHSIVSSTADLMNRQRKH